jgi:hypothetical protein
MFSGFRKFLPDLRGFSPDLRNLIRINEFTLVQRAIFLI